MKKNETMYHPQTYTYIIHSVCVYCVSQLYVSVEGSSKINAKNLRHCFSVTAEWEFVIYTRRKKEPAWDGYQS